GTAAALATTRTLLQQLAVTPQRLAYAATGPSDIQFDIANFIAPAQTINGVTVRFGPVFTQFVPAKPTRTPRGPDQFVLAEALKTIEQAYPFTPAGVFTFVSYGLPYFNRLPQGLVAAAIPR